MKKFEWLLVLAPLIFCVFVDQVTKGWAETLTTAKTFGFLTFSLHHNPGAMLGLFADLPPLLRVVTLSTGGAFLVCLYVLIQYLLPIKSMTLRVGLSMLLGGILGNVADRIFYGYVIDFIIVGNIPAAFNMADALQWVGYVMVAVAIIKEGDILWPENDARRKYWINPSFQIKYCLILFGAGLGISLIFSVFSFTYLRVTMIEIVGQNEHVLDKFLIPFALTAAIVGLGFSAALFTVGKIISHKIAGPLYGFEKFVVDTINGKHRVFKVRSRDEFKHLEVLAVQLQEYLIANQLLKKDLAPTASNPEDLVNLQIEGAQLVEDLEKKLTQS